MSPVAKSVLFFGIYMLLEGAALLFVPNLLLSIFGIPATTEVWIRLVGLSVMILGFYYIQSARKNLTVFFSWTIPIRITQFLVILSLVLLSYGPPMILIFSFIELLSAFWTWSVMRQAKRKELT